jgi:steroid delta-isomerase-like uncharacterized protein
MSVEINKALARRFVMEHNQEGYTAAFEELLTPDCVVHEYLPGLPDALNRDAYHQFIAAFRSALPDIGNTIEDMVTEGDKIVVRWSGFGTHTGSALMGVPACGRAVLAHGVYMLRFENGKIAEVWNNWDNLNVLQQLGAPAA